MNGLPERWLFNLSLKNSAFHSIPTSLYFGSEDQWVNPNTNIWYVYPYSHQEIIDGGDHDVHHPNVQNGIKKSLPFTTPCLLRNIFL
jgi:hypothetical protein